MKRPAFIRGIRDKLIVAFSALVACIALFVYAFFPARLEKQSILATQARAAAVGEMAAYSLGAGLLFQDTLAVHEVLAGAARARDVSFLAVWDASGRLVARRGDGGPLRRPAPNEDGAITADGRTLVASIVVTSGETRVGTLALGLSLAPLRAQVAQARRIGALVSVLILAVGIFAILAISTFVTRPLTAVAGTVNRIAQGDLQSRAAETNDVEVRGLVVAFNHMIDTLVGTQAELAAMNEALEGRVESRTAQLTEAIEEQQRSQIALAASENDARRTSELLQSLIDLAPQAIVAVDLEWRVTRWNLAAEALFGWSSSEVVGQPVPFIPDTEQQAFRGIQLSMVSEQGIGPTEVIRKRKDGTSINVLLAAGSLRDRTQCAAGYIAIFTDLTERNRLEGQLRQAQKMEAMGRLAGGIAHDFNNILTIITACTEMLLSDAQDADDRSHLEHIAGAAARAASLTRQLLTFTRQQIVQAQSVDVGDVIRALVPMLQRVLPTNIRLVTVIPRRMGLVTADPTQLEQVLMNLVVNASDAMPNGGSLDVELSRVELDAQAASALDVEPGKYNWLVVRDSGAGIEEATLARIFEPFFTTKELGKGTGLGLATAYGIVTALGGAIRVRSVLGSGTTFELCIPESQKLVSEATVPAGASDDAAVESVIELARPLVLLIEDEPAVRQVVRRALERSGYDVLEASDGELGRAMVAEHGHRLAAVVTDMMMPGMSGRELAELLSVSHPELGVVCISGYTESGPNGGPLLDENHVFLQKPFTREQLVTALRSVRRGPALAG